MKSSFEKNTSLIDHSKGYMNDDELAELNKRVTALENELARLSA